MPEKLTKIYFGSSIGSTHIAKQTSNQDAVGSWIAPDGVHFCVAISDGHGSSAHPHSEYGSKLAVTITLEVYKEFFDQGLVSVDPIILFQRIITRWSAGCIEHFSEQISGENTPKDSILKLYGATLCITYVSGDSISIGSLGDSTVYFRNHSGHFSKFLIHDDVPGEATFSLCQTNPLAHVEVIHIPYSSGLIVLSTDGIIKSLKSAADYALIADYYLGLLNTDCPATQLSADLTSQLESFSRDGSGDDCTLAMVYIPVDKKFDRSSKSAPDKLHEYSEEYPLKIASGYKKKLLVPITKPLLLTSLLFIIALLSIVILYNPIKKHLLHLTRSTLCSKVLLPGQHQNLNRLVVGQ